MSDPQNLNQSSPGALNPGAPPVLSAPPLPALLNPSQAQASAPPPVINNVIAPTTVAGGGMQDPSNTMARGTQVSAANVAGGGAALSSAKQLGGNVVAAPQTVGEALGLCCDANGGISSGSGGGPPLPAIIVASVTALNAIVAGTVPVVCVAYVGAPISIWLTQNAGASWQQYS